MANLTKARKTREVSLKQISGVLQSGEQVFEGSLVAIDTAAGTLVRGQTGTGLLPIGLAIDIPETGTTGNGTLTIKVRLFREVIAFWFANATAGAALTSANVGQLCYVLDDQTVTNSATGNSVAGRVWNVNSTGVLVEPALNFGPQGEPGEDA